MELIERTCIGCGNTFMVMDVKGPVSNYCTRDCKESHSIFKSDRESKKATS